MGVTLDLFNEYSKMFLRGFEDTQGFIIDEQNVNILFHTDDTVLMEDT